MAGVRTLVASALLLSAAGAGAACVEVPDNIRAHFADPRAGEPNNFRKGPHGTARRAEDEPAAPAAKASESASDAGAAPAPVAFDGGVS